MRRRAFLLGVFACAADGIAQTAKQYRIAYLTGYSAPLDRPLLDALKSGLRDLGYIEGKSLIIDVEHADGHPERLAALAKRLASRRPDIFVVGSGAAAAEAVKNVAASTPIVMANVQDPVGSGLVTSLARPGGNITGLSDSHAASVTKRLELMKEAIPSLARVGVLWNPESKTNAAQLKDVRVAASSLALKIDDYPAKNPGELESALSKIRGRRGTALLLLGDFVLTTGIPVIARHAIEQRLPAVYTTHRWTDAGGFMAYGANFEDLYRRSALFVDKILKGAKPGDLAIEQPTKFDLIINLRTAKAIGIDVPRAVLLRADHVVE